MVLLLIMVLAPRRRNCVVVEPKKNKKIVGVTRYNDQQTTINCHVTIVVTAQSQLDLSWLFN